MTVFAPIFVGRRARRLRRVPRALARRRREGPGRPDGLDRDLPGGLRLGPTKVVEGGVQKPDITDLLGRNSRLSYPAIGDLGAQIACARTGQSRLVAIIERFGLETIKAARDEIFAQTERLRASGDRGDTGRRL